jgi:hypothetical protein
MKKIIYTVCLLLSIGTGYSQSSLEVPGRLKVSIENVKCHSKSWDGVVEFDGHGNEVSVTYSYRIYARSNWAAVKKGGDGTVIYGSNVNGMTRAGTQTPNLGGIKEGDKVDIFKTMFDEHIEAGDYIIIAPNVWEWDGPEKNTINSFNAQLEMDLDWATKQAYPFPDASINAPKPFDNRVFKIFDKYRYGPALKYQSIFSPIICNGNIQGNRIIGLNAGGSGPACQIAYPPTLLVLDTRVLGALYLNNQNAIRSANAGTSGPKLINGTEIWFEESTYNIQSSNGTYSVFLRIEFTPDVLPSFSPSNTSPNGLTGTPTKNVGTIKKDFPSKNLNISNTNLAVAGNWAGTKTTDTGLYPENFGLELTTNGEVLMKDIYGNVAVRGTYTFANNSITGSYKQLSSGETYSIGCSFDPNTQKISGTLGSGNAVTGQGKFTLSRK